MVGEVHLEEAEFHALGVQAHGLSSISALRGGTEDSHYSHL